MLATESTTLYQTSGLGGAVPPAPPSPTMDPSAYTQYGGGIIVERPIYPPPSQPPTYQPPVPQGNGMGQKPCGTCRGGGAPSVPSPTDTTAAPVKTAAPAAGSPVLTKPATWQWWMLVLAGAIGALVARKMLD